MYEVWQNGKQMFICGNGGSAGNAVHLANDFLYGVAQNTGRSGLRVEALSANTAIVTCLANDVGYADIYGVQLETKSNPDDLLLVLSGSGNSANVVRAIETGNQLGLKTSAILGYTGGRCLDVVDLPIHFPIDDMQISEDLQLVVGHMCMQWLNTTMKNEIGR